MELQEVSERSALIRKACHMLERTGEMRCLGVVVGTAWLHATDNSWTPLFF